eukprot:gene10575-14200_t
MTAGSFSIKPVANDLGWQASRFRLLRDYCRRPLAAIAAALKTSMKDDFDIDDVFLGLHAPAYRRHDIDGIVPIEANGAIARAYDNFLRTRLIDCGPI